MELLIRNTVWYMAGRDMITRRITVPLLIIEIHIGIEGPQEFTLIQAP